ncbi:hypothetical protein MNBD_IGNAVI01-2411, partial [hydrothermal vent metagenome]
KCSEPKTNEIKPVFMNGEPRFIIGSYHNPKDLNELKILAENGFNLVRCAPDSNDLDMAKEAGLNAWINTGNRIDFSKDKNKHKEKLIELVEKFKDHPALAVWEVPDEALWSLGYPKFEFMFYGKNWSVEQQDSILKVLDEAIPEKAKGFVKGYEQLKKIDSIHPVWMNFAPRNTLDQLRLFAKAADIIGCDIYPGKKGVDGHNDLYNYRMSSVGGYTDIMQSAAPNKPVWMVLQGFSWDFLRLKDTRPENLDPEEFPTYKHSRFMAWDAILHGAKGILYWGSYMVSPRSLFWNSILGVTKEIAALEPFLLEKELKNKITVEPIQFTSSVKTRVASTLRKHNDDYLLVVLQEDLSQALNVSGLDFLEGKTLYELTTDRSYVVKDGKIRVWFGKEPHVLCTSKKYDVVHESEFPLTWDNEDNFPLNEK